MTISVGATMAPLVTCMATAVASRLVGTSRLLLALMGLAALAPLADAKEATSVDPTAPGVAVAESANSSGSNTYQAPEVTVQAPRRTLENQVHVFVERLTHSPRFSDESIPRWGQPLCFAVAGLPNNKGEFVLARLSRVASSAGAKIRSGRCSLQTANFYVVFTPNPGETLKYLRHHRALLFNRDATQRQIERFLSPPKSQVVRVWHNAEFVGRDGASLVPGSSASCASIPGTLVNCDFGASRLTVPAVQDFTRTLVVIDLSRLAGINLGQISDYAAMAGLVDFDLDGYACDAPSILCLFTEPSKRPEELTVWDQAFLTALYNTDRHSPLQRMQIAARMVDDVSH